MRPRRAPPRRPEWTFASQSPSPVIALLRCVQRSLRLCLIDVLAIEAALFRPLRPSHTDPLHRKAAASILLLLADDLVGIGDLLATLLLLLLLRLRLGKGRSRSH